MDPASESLSSRRLTGIPSLLLIVLLGAVVHLPRLDLAFGSADINAGTYFGLFVKQFEDFGFWELRGMPLGPGRLTSTDLAGLPYLNHPPGITWLSALLGSAEWVFRLPTAIAATVAACALFLLLRPVLGGLGALLAGVCLLGTPSAVIYSQASYETMVLGFGLMLWLTTIRVHESTGRARGRWRVAQVAVSFFGVWMDWSYLFFCLALVPIAVRRSVRETVARLWVPALVSGIAVASVTAWRMWALRGPRLPESLPDPSLAEMVETTILARMPLADYLPLSGHILSVACGVPLAVAALFGVWQLWRCSRGLTLAFLLSGLGQPLVFSHHATDHVHFYCYTAGMLAAAAGGITAFRSPQLRITGGIALLLVTAATWWAGVAATRDSDTRFYRDQGQVLTNATENIGPDGKPRKAYRVALNFGFYPYYVESPFVNCNAEPGAVLEPHRSNPQLPYGFRYLWFRDIGGPSAASMVFAGASAELEEFLTPFPKTRVPELQGKIGGAYVGLGYELNEVYLVDVPPRFQLAVAHAGEDATMANQLAEQLRGDGLAMSFEQVAAIPADAPVAADLIRQATHVVVLWSAGLERAGTWRDLAAGLDQRVERGYPLVIARLDAAELPAELRSVSQSEAGDAIDLADVDRGAFPTAVVRSFEQIAAREDQVWRRRQAARNN